MKKYKSFISKGSYNKTQAGDEKYRSLIENMNLGLLEVDLDETIVYANKSFCEMVGYDCKEIYGKNASSLLLSGDQSMVMEAKNASRLDGKSSVYEIPVLSKSGKVVWMLISGGSLYDENGKVIGSIGIHLDITNRREIENQRMLLLKKEEQIKTSLLENEERLKAIINSSLDAIVTIDQQGLITKWNNQAEKIFGFTNEEAIGKSLTETIIPPQYRDAHTRGMAHHAKTGEGPVLNKRIEITAINKEGHEFPIELSIAPIKIKGKFFFSAFMRDITVEKESKLEMERALKKEKELSELKSRFVTMTSHEFRTPLTTIQTNIEILSFKLDKENPELGKTFSKNFNRIDSEVKRLTGLMNDVLILGRLESGKLDCNPEPTDLVQYCEHLIDTAFTNKDIHDNVEFSYSGTPQKVSVDQNLYGHVITNLLSNAFKYGRDGKAKLEVHFTDSEAHIKVSDTGIGIPEDDLEHLFDSFFRASNVNNIQGTGLGLSIVKQFVEMHNGEISVESVENKGTTFTVKQKLVL